MAKRRTAFPKAVSIVLLFAGVGIFFYPMVSNMYHQYLHDRSIDMYSKAVEKMTDSQLKSEFRKAKKYNRKHPNITFRDAFGEEQDEEVRDQYLGILDPTGSGIMGYIEIPKINVRLPVYHGTSESVLANGCGHVYGTHFPLGEKGTHSVLAAHRGLPSAKLFTDLDQLRIGNRFYIYIYNRQYSYEVDDIKSVRPDAIDKLRVASGRASVTLLTCTPYGVNSHRLLIKGHRIPNGSKEKRGIPYDILAVIILIQLLLLLLIICLIRRGRKKTGTLR